MVSSVSVGPVLMTSKYTTPTDAPGAVERDQAPTTLIDPDDAASAAGAIGASTSALPAVAAASSHAASNDRNKGVLRTTRK